MLGEWQHRAGVAVAVAGSELGIVFGNGRFAAVGYALAALLGCLLAVQGDRRTVSGSVSANAMLGYAAGTAICALVTGALLVSLMGFPWDLAFWRTGILAWGAWVGVAGVLVSAFFLTGLASSMR